MRQSIKYLLIVVAILLAIRVFQEAILFAPYQKSISQPSFIEPKISNLIINVVDKSGKLVIFDESHKNSHSIYSGYSKFASIFSEAKYNVKATEKNFTEELLFKPNVLVLVSPTESYIDDEVLLIKKLVELGTTLIVLGDIDSVNALNKVTLNHGISFNEDLVYDAEKYTITSNYPLITRFEFSPVTKGLTEVALMEGCSLSLSPSAKILAFSGKTTKSSIYFGNLTLLSTAEFGSGKIFAVCDSDLFSNKFLKFFDHEILARNIVNWS